MARKYQLQRPEGNSGIDYSGELNAEQHAAVTSWPPGPALVIAGAGSGKTRTLTYRVAWLLDRGVPPSAILLLTFTNKAAREMLRRVEELVPGDLSTLWGGTFHSVGNRMLRRHADLVGWKRGFSILDREDSKDLMASAIEGAGVNPREYRFPKPEVVCDISSYARNTGQSWGQVLADRYPYFSHLEEKIGDVLREYARRKVATNSMDFDDLLEQTVRLLEEQEDVRESYRRKFQFLLVDEFQDTNTLQGRMIDLLAAEGGGLMVVGDDAQSIYSWRGADFQNILRFPERREGTRVFKIETNYRSVPGVLELANSSIACNVNQFEKVLRAARPAGGAPPALVTVNDPGEQARFVAQRILELRDEGVDLREMAVLYRAHYLSLDVQMELTARGIPFRITSGLRFFEQAHVKDVAAFLRLAANPADEISFKRMVRLLPGIGGKSADTLWRQWSGADHGPDEQRRAPSEITQGMKVPTRAMGAWEQLGYTLDELVPGGQLAKPAEAVTSVMEGVYDDLMRAKFTNYEARRQDLEQLRAFASASKSLDELLAELALLTGVDVAADGRKEEDDEMVTLSSVHQAKGLEYQAVFVIWLCDGLFPNARAVEDADPASFEEERRLFYVAMTRAKDQLYLCHPVLWPGNRSGDILQRPSPFVEELPAELMEVWEVGGS